MLLRLGVLRVSSCSKCLFLYGAFCHGALTLDLFALFATFAFQNLLELNSINVIYLFPLQIVIVAVDGLLF